ncbi:hypothetical protein ACWF82_32790 [Nocardia sp. NPDC055053]
MGGGNHAGTGDVVPRTDRGLTEAGDVGHRQYILGKLAEGAAALNTARDPQRWQTEVERWGDRKTRHDMMMHGHLEMTGRTAEENWRHEVVQKTPMGDRRHDVAKVNPKTHKVGKAVEYKAGWVGREEGLKQLAKDEFLLTFGQVQEAEYIVRGTDPPHPDVLAEAKRLAQKYPAQFKVIELSDKQFEQAIELGRPVVRAQAARKLEKAIEQVRETPELRTAFPALKGFLREIEKANERGQPISLEVLIGSRDELANLIEVDRATTQEIDKAAREAANLRLKDALVVEHVQAQKRDERYQEMNRLLGRVDTAVVHAAARVVEGHVAVRDREAIREQIKAIQQRDIDQGSKRQLIDRIGEHVRVAKSLREEHEREQWDEREVLDNLGLHPYYRDAAAKELENRRQERDRGIAGQLMLAADPANSKPSAQEADKARAEEKARAERDKARDLEKAKLLERIVDTHNARLAEVAREQAERLARDDPASSARAAQQVEASRKALQLDKEVLAQQVDPRAINGLLHGGVRWERDLQAYSLEVSPGETLYFGRSSYEAYYAEQIARVDRGQELDVVETNQLMRMGSREKDIASSRERLEQIRDQDARERAELGRRGTQHRTQVREREMQDRARGQERGRR